MTGGMSTFAAESFQLRDLNFEERGTRKNEKMKD